ncbi:MAG: OmpA family protein [Nitrosomonadales bacterium]|nr:OmpA family protein [Nitrosomonadales bacterium]
MNSYANLRLIKASLFASLTCMMLFGQPVYAEPTLNQPDDRITDQAIKADRETYEQTQARIAALNNLGIPVADYHLSKAQCWLDVSLHEYTRNDRSPFPQEALSQSDKILAALEAKEQPNGETPLVNNADRLREDLWERTAKLKSAPGFSCYAQKLACAEVELVHAGNEHKQQGWRHAKPYIQIAEDLVAEAAAIGESCLPVTAVIKAPEKVSERLDISADALFKFDKSALSDLLPAGKARLDELVAKLNEVYVEIDNIVLTGYTDRLGSEQYNQRLSEQRAETVKQYLRAKGVSSPIVATGKGATDQVVACGTETRPTKELINCLQPNRRVSIEVSGVKNQDSR